MGGWCLLKEEKEKENKESHFFQRRTELKKMPGHWLRAYKGIGRIQLHTNLNQIKPQNNTKVSRKKKGKEISGRRAIFFHFFSPSFFSSSFSSSPCPNEKKKEEKLFGHVCPCVRLSVFQFFFPRQINFSRFFVRRCCCYYSTLARLQNSHNWLYTTTVNWNSKKRRRRYTAGWISE